MNQASGTNGTIKNDSTFVSLEVPKEKRKESGAEGVFEEIMAETFPCLAKAQTHSINETISQEYRGKVTFR